MATWPEHEGGGGPPRSSAPRRRSAATCARPRSSPPARSRGGSAPRRAEGREPAAHRLVQGPRRPQPGRRARRRPSSPAGWSRRAPATTPRRSRSPPARAARGRCLMPSNAPLAKVEAVRAYGGDGPVRRRRLRRCGGGGRELAEREGPTLIHAFDDPIVIAGQGTVGLEIAEPGAGGDDWSWSRSAAGRWPPGSRSRSRSACPGVRVVGVQSDRCAPYPESLAARQPIGARAASTICDGIAVKRPGRAHRAAGLRVRRRGRLRLRRRGRPGDGALLERSKLVVEGAGAASVAALLAGRVGRRRGRGLRGALRRQRGRGAADRVHPARRDGRRAAAGVLDRRLRSAGRARAAARQGRRAGRERARRRPHLARGSTCTCARPGSGSSCRPTAASTASGCSPRSASRGSRSSPEDDG